MSGLFLLNQCVLMKLTDHLSSMVFLVRNDYSTSITVVSIGFVMFDVMFDLDSSFIVVRL